MILPGTGRGTSFLLAATLLAAPVFAQVAEEEVGPTAIERHLDSAYEALNEAGSHACERSASQQYDLVWDRFTRAMARAEGVLKRPPVTRMFGNSCLIRPDPNRLAQFVRLAEQHLDSVDTFMNASKH